MPHANQRVIKIRGRRESLQFVLVKRKRLAERHAMQACRRSIITVETVGLPQDNPEPYRPTFFFEKAGLVAGRDKVPKCRPLRQGICQAASGYLIQFREPGVIPVVVKIRCEIFCVKMPHIIPASNPNVGLLSFPEVSQTSSYNSADGAVLRPSGRLRPKAASTFVCLTFGSLVGPHK
jgi:hypothetical protein